MGTEVRIGVAAGLLIVVVAGAYFFYGSIREGDDLRIVTGAMPTSETPKIPAGRDDTSRPAKSTVARFTPPAVASPQKSATPSRMAAAPRTTGATPPAAALSTGSMNSGDSVLSPAINPSRTVTIPAMAANTDKPSDTGASTSIITPVTKPAANNTFASRTPAAGATPMDQSPLLPEAVPSGLLRTSPSSELIEATRRNLAAADPATPAPNANEPKLTRKTRPQEANARPDANPTRKEAQAGGTITLPPSLQATPTDRANEPTKTTLASNDPRGKPISATRPISTQTGADQITLAVSSTAKAESWPKRHTIVQGDTVAALSAQYYGTTRHLQRIMKANPSLDPRRMKIGDVIIIPDSEEAPAAPIAIDSARRNDAPAAASPAPAVSAKTEARPTTKSYTVLEGDTFYSIAQRTMGSGSKWNTLYEANKSVVKNNKRGLKAGMILTIPAD